VEKEGQLCSLSSVSRLDQKVMIKDFQGPAQLTERLQELGFCKDEEVVYLGRAPLRGPMIFRIGTTVIALREEEAQCLLVQLSPL